MAPSSHCFPTKLAVSVVDLGHANLQLLCELPIGWPSVKTSRESQRTVDSHGPSVVVLATVLITLRTVTHVSKFGRISDDPVMFFFGSLICVNTPSMDFFEKSFLNFWIYDLERTLHSLSSGFEKQAAHPSVSHLWTYLLVGL